MYLFYIHVAGGKLDDIMHLVVPLIYEVQAHVMLQYEGFTADDAGFELFAKCLAHYESDASFKSLSEQFKKKMKSLTEVNQFNV
jgi:hypothetical protein